MASLCSQHKLWLKLHTISILLIRSIVLPSRTSSSDLAVTLEHAARMSFVVVFDLGGPTSNHTGYIGNYSLTFEEKLEPCLPVILYKLNLGAPTLLILKLEPCEQQSTWEQHSLTFVLIGV